MQVFDRVSSRVLEIRNTSLQTGVFPDVLDGKAPSSIRPISNLSFISKILQSFFKKTRSWRKDFRINHSTETALTNIISHLRLSSDGNKV